MAINRQERIRAQMEQEAARRANRRAWNLAHGLPVEDEPVNAAPPVENERNWNVPPINDLRGAEGEHWWDVQRAIRVDIEAVPARPPRFINLNERIRVEEAMQAGLALNPWAPRAMRVEEEDNMQGKKYGEDYS